MSIYNTASDAANTAVRCFLTKVGEYYLQRDFNTGSGKGKNDWLRIRDKVFKGRCAYCGDKSALLQIEHLIMFNRAEYGLHHPGNIIPCCIGCNKRERKDDKTFTNWVEHLKRVCVRRGESKLYQSRLLKIKRHMTNEGYPDLNNEEKHAIRVIANSLYDNIKMESEKSLNLYRALDQAFVKTE